MDHQGFDPPANAPVDVVAFMSGLKCRKISMQTKRQLRLLPPKVKRKVTTPTDQKSCTAACCTATTTLMTPLSVRHFRCKLRS